jgi:HK97 family phage prohead protease
LLTKAFALDLKEVGEDGSFTGYGSMFGNADSYGEIVEPGAFAASLKAHARAKTMPLMLWQHDTERPIGIWEEMEEDNKGLRCVGRLLLGIRQADEAHIMLKAGAIRGLSIGYRELAAEPDGNNRRLKKLDLREVSIVSFPANDKATIQSVKSILAEGELPTVRQFEEHLRDAGFSKSLAAAIASKATPHLRGEPEAQADDAMAFLQALRGR